MLARARGHVVHVLDENIAHKTGTGTRQKLCLGFQGSFQRPKEMSIFEAIALQISLVFKVGRSLVEILQRIALKVYGHLLRLGKDLWNPRQSFFHL